MADFVPKAALDYIKNKKLHPAFSYKDVWHEEHAVGFTVAKATQLNVLTELHNAVTEAIEKGETFEHFKKNIEPLLRQEGWWGQKMMEDPLTHKMVKAQLGSDRRLRTIYQVNLRSAYQKGQYERTMASDLHPYLMYRIGPSVHHREQHLAWDGLILPKTDPFWDSRFPPNGWGCKCYTRAVSEARKKQYEANGITVPPAADGTGGGTIPVKTEAPPEHYTTFYNERKGTFEKVPEGVDPAFNWNQGKAPRDAAANDALKQAEAGYYAATGETKPGALVKGGTDEQSFKLFNDYVHEQFGENITIDPDLQGRDTALMAESARGIKAMQRKFPALKDYFKGFVEADREKDLMDSGSDFKIGFGLKYKNRDKLLADLEGSIEAGFYQKDMSITDLGTHESIHLLEFMIENENGNIADEIITKAFNEANRKAQNKYSSWKAMAAEIDGNAKEDTSECLVESVLDYLKHGKNAGLFSQKVYTIFRGEYRDKF